MSATYLTPAMRRFLTAIRDEPDGFAIQEGIAVWVGLTRFHSGTVLKCLRLCLVRENRFSDGHTRTWILNEDGRKILEDSAYIPRIVRAFQENSR